MEGRTSQQAHANLPAGTYEREVGREGFFGAATHIYHAHPPTGGAIGKDLRAREPSTPPA